MTQPVRIRPAPAAPTLAGRLPVPLQGGAIHVIDASPRSEAMGVDYIPTSGSVGPLETRQRTGLC